MPSLDLASPSGGEIRVFQIPMFFRLVWLTEGFRPSQGHDRYAENDALATLISIWKGFLQANDFVKVLFLFLFMANRLIIVVM